MPFPDLPPERIPGSPGHLNDHQLIDQALDYIQQAGYRDDPDFPPLPDVPVLGESGHVTAHDRILAVLEYVKGNPSGAFVWATVSNTPTGTYTGDDGHTYGYYLFESDGTLTVATGGLVEALIVAGGGGGAVYDGSYYNGYGSVAQGYYALAPDSYDVGVGQGGPKNGTTSSGSPSKLGSIEAQGGPQARFPHGVVNQWTSAITGTPTVYGKGNTTETGYGYGHPANPAGAGSAGVVIVRTRLN